MDFDMMDDIDGSAFATVRDRNTRFQDIGKLLPPKRKATDEVLFSCKNEIHRKLTQMDWEKNSVEQVGAEVASILDLAKEYGEKLIDEQAVILLFQSKNFLLPIGYLPLSLIHYLGTLPPKMGMGMGMDDIDMMRMMESSRGSGIKLPPRELSPMLCKSVVHWIQNMFNLSRDKKPEEAAGTGKRRRAKMGALLGNLRSRKDTPTNIDHGEETIAQVLEALFNWWRASVLRLEEEKNTLIKETEWIAQMHLTSIFENPECAQEVILNIPTACKSNLPSLLQRAYVEAICSCAAVLPAGSVFNLLYADSKSVLASSQKKWTAFHRYLNRRIMETVIINTQPATQEQNGLSVKSLLSLLSSHHTTWPNYMYWFAEQSKMIKTEKLNEGQTKHWEVLGKYFELGKHIFQTAYESIVSGNCIIGLVKISMLPNNLAALKNCWKALDMNNGMIEIESLQGEIEALWSFLGDIRTVTDTFLNGSETQNTVLNLQKNWFSLRILELRHFFRSSDSFSVQNRAEQGLRFPALDANFLNAAPWLRSLVESKLFMLIWREQSGTDDLDKLLPASLAWNKEYNDFQSRITTFKRMKAIAPILDARDERKYFCNTAPGFSSELTAWKIIGSKKQVKTEMRTLVSEWLHLHAVQTTVLSIIRVLDCLHLFIKSSGISSLEEAKNAASSLRVVFTKEVFDEKTIAEQGRFTVHSEKLHSCFVTLSAELFEKIVKCTALLDWLRELTDDSDFTNGIEEAMGKSEMECPVELWQEQEGKPGRVDEQKLSMLSTVRGYLHELIYRRSDRLDNLASLVNILKELRETDENIINSLETANQFRIPLRELLDDKSENGAPDRLLQLLLPIRKAQWICTSERDLERDNANTTAAGNIWLQWEVPRAGEVSNKKQNLNELMDFQSSIVLAKTDQQGQEVLAAIENFIHQFGWVRQLNENLTNLLQSGHFDYQSFHISFPLTVNADVIHEEAIRSEEILSEWTRVVEDQRNSFYFLNYYSMRHVWKLVSTIRSIDEEDIPGMGSPDEKYITMRDTLCMINPDVCSEGEVLDFISEFFALWNKSESDPKNILTATKALTLCGACLEESGKKIPSRTRSVVIADVAKYPAGANIYDGLNVVCAESSQSVYDHVLSSYARAGYLPERELIHVCRPSTTWDDVYTLLLRWARSHLYGREKKFYCLASIENISFELQRKAANLIKENQSEDASPLLVISGNDDKQYLVAQFAHCRTSVISLPEEVIQSFSAELGTNFSNGVATHSSRFSGAGKTFNIRTTADKLQARYIPVAVMRSGAVIPSINAAITQHDISFDMDDILLHLDVYDTAQECLNPLLFDLLFLGGIEDNIAGIQYFWNPQQTSIAVEMPTGNLMDKIRMAALLPRQEATVGGDTFCTSQRALLVGMGADDFNTARNDGTSIAINASTAGELSAYTRLAYVCLGLDIMDVNQGRFPFVFEQSGSILESLRTSSATRGKDVLSSKRCYELLMNALDLKQPSLWCIWNFVNVFYWQLRDMHHPDSPINCACMPDNSEHTRKGDTITKEKYKGEVTQFLIRTAREFATRQVKEIETDAVVGVHVSGMSRQEFNGVWERMDCENDGMPAFQKRSAFGSKNFIYFRKEETAWVLDDCIDPTGPVYSRCEKGRDIDGLWGTTPEWAENPKIKVAVVSDKKGFNGEALRVTGCEDDGGSVSAKENGVYLRLPEYDNINGNPHYVRNVSEKVRRHIFIGKDGGWQICPVCTEDEGVYCMSSSKNLNARWRAVPPDKKEDRAHLIMLNEEELLEYKKKPVVSYARAVIRDRDSEKAKQISLRESMSKSLGVELEEEPEETMEELWDNTVKWNDSNHECVLFSNESHVVSFLSLNPDRLKTRMHPGLLAHLERNRIVVGEDLDEVNGRFHEILSSLTEVKKSAAQAKLILGGKYCHTGDSLLKMLAIFARLRCGVPVVLMGECGCGKTMLIKYLCAWMDVNVHILDVHGGTSEEDIVTIFEQANHAVTTGKQNKVFVFLDEINTCAHMGLMCEVICHRTLYSKRIHDNIYVLAALNPYRRRPDQGHVPGLVFQLQGGAVTTPDPMASLVYRVHPIPRTLQDFIFDFGALTPTNEKMYILSMVKDKLDVSASQFVITHVANMIHHSQQYIRKVERDDSSASLRDVRRCLRLIDWFTHIVQHDNDSVGKKKGEEGMKMHGNLNALGCSTVLALSFVYYFRLSSSVDRANYWDTIGIANSEISWRSKDMDDSGFAALKEPGAFAALLKTFRNFIGRQVLVEPGIAMNDALMENLFVVIICILTRIPIFVVGKPGSSKTLTMQVIASNLQGKQSPNDFWKKYPAVYIFPYQCSPMSDSHSIQHQFDMAVRYQEHAENTITVLLLDEVGLAEHSPDMPLKVLHGMLVDPPIAVVGLSNWVLDPAKMNRAILLQRTEPSEDDIQMTGMSIVGAGRNSNILDKYLQPLAKAYHKIYTNQKGRDFVGMRDYYNLVKLLSTKLGKSKTLDANVLTVSLCRNFGGKRDLLDDVLTSFHVNCFGNTEKLVVPPLDQLINENLHDKKARHLMLLTKNSAALPIMFGCGLLNERTTKLLVGSEFKDDRTELHLITQINEVKLAMAEGTSLVLLNHDNIYEALYDVLNQRYLFKKDNHGNVKKMLRLAIGSRSQLCNVAEGFKIVVIVEQDHAYRNLDLPLLNRFEKQVLCGEDVLGPAQQKLVGQLVAWAESIMESTGLASMQEVFCGYHAGTIPSAVLNYTHFKDENVDTNAFSIIQKWLYQVARPIAIMNCPSLQGVDETDYFQIHSSLASILDHFVYPISGFGSLCMSLTHSPVSHLDEVLKKSTPRCPVSNILLGELTSERQMQSRLSHFFSVKENTKNEQLLIIQCDPIVCRQSLTNHARYLTMKARSDYTYAHRNDMEQYSRHVLFLIHLPPGTKQRSRHFALDFIHPWTYAFVDDLRFEDENNTSSTVTLLSTSVYDLVQAGTVSVRKIMLSKYQHALSCCMIPEVSDTAGYFGNRVETLENLLLKHAVFPDFVEQTILSILKNTKEKVKLSNKKDAALVPLHVKMVCEDLVGGSLRQSLSIAVEMLIVQALAHVIRELDYNFNLASIWRQDEISAKLWFSLLACPAIIQQDTIAVKAHVGGQAFVSSKPVPNTGNFKPLVCRFPYSYRIIPVLNERSTREQVEILDADPQETLENLCPSIFGEEVVANWTVFGGKEHVAYLHDYVATSLIPVPGAHFETTMTLVESIFRISRPNCFTSPASIHVVGWENENRLFRCGSLLANTQMKEEARQTILDSLHSISLPLADADVSIGAIRLRLAQFDYVMLHKLMEYYWKRVQEPSLYSSFSTLTRFVAEFASLRSDVELYLLSMNFFDGTALYQSLTLKDLRRSFLGLRLVHIYFQEVCMELGFQNIEITKPSDLLNLASSLCIDSLPFIKDLVKAFTIHIPVNHQHIGLAFVRRYLQEIVFGEQEGFFNIGLHTSFTPSFLSQLEGIFNNTSDTKEVELHLLGSDLAISRALLHCLTNANHSLTLPSINSLQLYLQQKHDKFSEEKGWKNILKQSDLDCARQNPALFKQSQAQEKRTYLTALARIETCIREYSNNLLHREDTAMSHFLFPLLDSILQDKSDAGHHARVLVLKFIKGIGGIDALGEILHDKEIVSWMPINRGMSANASISLPDPFVWIKTKEEYETMCGAVRVCITQSSNPTVQLDKIDLSEAGHPLLIASVFSQVSLDSDIAFDKGIKSLRTFVTKKIQERFELQVLDWACSGCPTFSQYFNTSSLNGMCTLQVGMNILLWALEMPNSWLHALYFQPEVQKNSFLISIPNDEFASIAKASGRVGWYVCPNGHKYSVGNCTQPMQKATCPSCGLPIGGSNHKSVDGVTRLKDLDLQGDPDRGYPLAESESEAIRMSPVPSRFLRFLLHMALFTGSCLSKKGHKALIALLSPKDKPISDPCQFLADRLKKDWKRLKQLSGFGDGDLTLAMHLIFRDLRNTTLDNAAILNTTTNRDREENRIAASVNRYFSDSQIKIKIETARQDLQDANSTSAIRLTTGEKLWYQTHEEQFADISKADLQTLLWRFREPVSFQQFSQFWGVQNPAETASFSLLRTLLKEEEKLPAIHGICDILEWHAILFEILPQMSISREEATDITNKDILDKLPQERQEKARELLLRFCCVYNQILPTIDPLFECTANPFIKNGRVSINDQEMNENTPVGFSLPSSGGKGENRAPEGMCTIRILQVLVDSQNEILQAIEESQKKKKGGFKKLPGSGPAVAAAQPEVAAQPAEVPEVPAINFKTPREVLEIQLIVYQRAKHLLPLLRMFSIQPLEYKRGGELSYRLRDIEKALANGLLAGKRQINLCINHFQYSGDLMLMGGLSSLENKVPQDRILSAVVTEAIANEVNTQNQTKRLLQLLDICIQFIVSIGSSNASGFDGRTTLSSCMANLKIPKEEWESVSTPTIRQHICLRNIQALYMLLESMTGNSPLDNVLMAFSEDLAESQERDLRMASKKLNLNVLLPFLYDWMTITLPASQEFLKPEYDLKETLDETDELGDSDWWEDHFPECGITLASIKSVYLLLKKC